MPAHTTHDTNAWAVYTTQAYVSITTASKNKMTVTGYI